jgi:hypothetical protein
MTTAIAMISAKNFLFMMNLHKFILHF